jgi:hypothetical protein
VFSWLGIFGPWLDLTWLRPPKFFTDLTWTSSHSHVTWRQVNLSHDLNDLSWRQENTEIFVDCCWMASSLHTRMIVYRWFFSCNLSLIFWELHYIAQGKKMKNRNKYKMKHIRQSLSSPLLVDQRSKGCVRPCFAQLFVNPFFGLCFRPAIANSFLF